MGAAFWRICRAFCVSSIHAWSLPQAISAASCSRVGRLPFGKPHPLAGKFTLGTLQVRRFGGEISRRLFRLLPCHIHRRRIEFSLDLIKRRLFLANLFTHPRLGVPRMP